MTRRIDRIHEARPRTAPVVPVDSWRAVTIEEDP